MADKIVQLQNKGGDNLYPLAGGMVNDSVTKAMMVEGVFEGETLSTPSSVDYVATDNIQNAAVTPAKIDWTTINSIFPNSKLENNAVSLAAGDNFVSSMALDVSNIPDGSTFFVRVEGCVYLSSENTGTLQASDIRFTPTYNGTAPGINGTWLEATTNHRMPVSSIAKFTKVNGVNTVTMNIKAGKAQKYGIIVIATTSPF